ncbi:MAG TPA: hypothetical protein VGC91_01270 [Pyrinomonadaceae bacterium]
MQREIDEVEDRKMKSMLARGDQDIRLVKSWMRGYGLFQGIITENRDKIANRFLSFATSVRATVSVADRKILEEKYSELFTALFSEVNRSWMSATSKLLWCIYPNEVVIYDSFVARALVVMQCLDGDLANFPRINVPPKVARESEIVLAVKHYMNYQDMVKHIFERNFDTLNELRKEHKENYPHDIRIIDKLLWMIGNPKQRFNNLA